MSIKKLYLKKVMHITLGVILVIVGILGVILPFIHGTLPLFTGLILLSFESIWLEKKLLHLASKNKYAKKIHATLDTKLKDFFGIDIKKILND
jgi:uncharacterized membrane protein YbaN (DUF454 family)